MSRGAWPKLYRLAHLGVMVLLGPLLITGLMLYVPSWHTALIPWLGALVAVHVAMAILFLACLVVPLLTRLPVRKLHLGEWGNSFGLTIAIFITGIVILVVLPIPSSLEILSIPLHGVLAVILLLWTIRHGYYASKSRSKMAGPLEMMPRRAFLTWGVRGVIGLGVAGLGLSQWYRLWHAISTPESAQASSGGTVYESTYQPGFQYYTVTVGYPQIDMATYRVTVGGLVEKPMRMTIPDFIKAFPIMSMKERFFCVTGWNVPNCHWKGISLSSIIKAAGAKKEAKYVLFRSADGIYTESLPLELVMMRPKIMVAFELNGAPLPSRGGAPLRLIVPGMNGYKSIKWLNEIWLSEKDDKGYWERRGYPENAWVGIIG